jgi:hypothetical protein
MIDQLRTDSNSEVLQEELKTALNKANQWPVGKGRYMDADYYLVSAMAFEYIVYIPRVPRDFSKLRPYTGSKVRSTGLLEAACGGEYCVVEYYPGVCAYIWAVLLGWTTTEPVSDKSGAAEILIFLVLGKLAGWIYKRF